jgi:hypothetical protein
MKVAIVKSSIIFREGRLDATHYLGKTEEELKKARIALEKAHQRFLLAQKKHAVEKARIQNLIKSGDVRPIK